jgi:hypothetical protein
MGELKGQVLSLLLVLLVFGLLVGAFSGIFNQVIQDLSLLANDAFGMTMEQVTSAIKIFF